MPLVSGAVQTRQHCRPVRPPTLQPWRPFIRLSYASLAGVFVSFASLTVVTIAAGSLPNATTALAAVAGGMGHCCALLCHCPACPIALTALANLHYRLQLQPHPAVLQCPRLSTASPRSSCSHSSRPPAFGALGAGLTVAGVAWRVCAQRAVGTQQLQLNLHARPSAPSLDRSVGNGLGTGSGAMARLSARAAATMVPLLWLPLALVLSLPSSQDFLIACFTKDPDSALVRTARHLLWMQAGQLALDGSQLGAPR